MTLASLRRQAGWVSPLLLIALIVGVWEIAVRLSGVPLWLLPAPSDVVRSLVEDRDILLPNALVTFSEVLVGFACAVVAGVGLGIAVYRSPTLNRAFYPIIIASQTIPIPALAPLLLVSLGYGLLPKVIVTALVGFFPIVVNTVEGLRSTDRDVVNLLRSLRRLPRKGLSSGGISVEPAVDLRRRPDRRRNLRHRRRIRRARRRQSRSRLSDDPRHRAVRDTENGRGDRLALRDEHEPVRHGRSRRASGVTVAQILHDDPLVDPRHPRVSCAHVSAPPAAAKHPAWLPRAGPQFPARAAGIAHVRIQPRASSGRVCRRPETPPRRQADSGKRLGHR